MVAYELSMIVKGLSKAKIASSVKRTAEMILSHRGHLEKIEFLGTRQLPAIIKSHGQIHNRGSYFLIHFHAPYESKTEIDDDCKRDTDIIRKLLIKKEVPANFICTLHEEIKPPPEREDVKKMISEASLRMPYGIKMRKKQRRELVNYKF